VAREALVKKGMDEAQITGACSSYSRKYNLNGLFAIDDTKDADSEEYQPTPAKKAPPEKSSKITTIEGRVSTADVGWIKSNWSGMIADEWGNLSLDIQNKLNEMAQ